MGMFDLQWPIACTSEYLHIQMAFVLDGSVPIVFLHRCQLCQYALPRLQPNPCIHWLTYHCAAGWLHEPGASGAVAAVS